MKTIRAWILAGNAFCQSGLQKTNIKESEITHKNKLATDLRKQWLWYAPSESLDVKKRRKKIEKEKKRSSFYYYNTLFQ